MANGPTTKRPREEPEGSDSDSILAFSDNDNESQDKAQDKGDKKVKLEGSHKSTAVWDAAVKKLRLASKGSIGIPAVRALLVKSGSSSTRFTDAAKETNLGSRKSARVATAGSGSRKSSNTKGKESIVSLVFLFLHLCITTNHRQQEECPLQWSLRRWRLPSFSVWKSGLVRFFGAPGP